jgi:hypothetical protein
MEEIQSELSKTLINMAESMGEDNFLEWANTLIKARIEQQNKKDTLIKEQQEESKKQAQKQREEEREKWLHPTNDSKYITEVEYINDYKVIHNTPIMNDEEKEEKKKETLFKIISFLSIESH